jgi:hypothetical protein
MTEFAASSVSCGMPYTLEALEDHALIVTVSGGRVRARAVPLDDVSRIRDEVESSVRRS